MIAINGKPMTELPKDDPLVVFINKAFSEIKRQKNWTIKWHDRHIKKATPGVLSSYDETPAGDLMLSSQKFVHDGTQHSLAYFETTRYDARDRLILNPRRMPFSGRITFDSVREVDKIFYYMCISQKCDVYPKMQKFQNPNKKTPLYVVEDLAVEASQMNTQEYLIGEVKRLLFNPDLGLDDNVIRELAVKYGVARALQDDVGVQILRGGLHNKIMIKRLGEYDFDLIKKFVEENKDSAGEVIPGLDEAVTAANNAGFLRKRQYGNRHNVELMDWADPELKTKKGKIVTVAATSDIEHEVYKYYLNHEKDALKFVEYVNEGLKSKTDGEN